MILIYNFLKHVYFVRFNLYINYIKMKVIFPLFLRHLNIFFVKQKNVTLKFQCIFQLNINYKCIDFINNFIYLKTSLIRCFTRTCEHNRFTNSY